MRKGRSRLVQRLLDKLATNRKEIQSYVESLEEINFGLAKEIEVANENVCAAKRG